MNQWILKAFSQFKLDAVNFGFRDLLYGKVVLEKGKYDAQVKETPMLGEMISANIIPAVDLNRNVALKPYVIREVTGKRFGSKTSLKVGFIGVSEPWPGGNTGFVINDPVEKVKAILPEVRSKSDLVVVLAYCSLGVSREIIKQNPDIDVLIAGNAVPLPPPAQREGKTIFVYSVQQTKSLGELRLYLDSDCKVKDYLNRYILLDTAIPDQAEAAKVVANAKAEIDVVKAKIAASEQAELELLRKNPEQNPGQTPVQNATGQPKSPVNPPKGKQNSAVKNEF
jgi:2',3'-cyclic-nucleotide 2'-phosphodiesterase (5'-nucleotidase family)